MKVYNHELSPFPGLLSTTQPRLKFTAAELKALQRTANILAEADKKATEYYRADDTEISNPSLGDLNMDLALMLCTGYLQDILATPEGLRLD